MFKKLIATFLSIFIVSGQGWTDTTIRPFPGQTGITFYADFTDNLNGINADRSNGNPFGIFTRVDDATHLSTYVDADGKVTAGTTNIARLPYGYWTTDGFHSSSTNLGSNANDFTSSPWKVVTVTTAADSTTDPDGTSLADTLTASGANATVTQRYSTNFSRAYTFSVFLKRKTGSGTVTISVDGGSTTLDVTANLSTTDWYRASITTTTTNPTAIIAIVTSADAIYAYDGEIKYNYPLGVMSEPATINRTLRSEDFSNASWTKPGGPDITVTANSIVSPDGTVDGDTLTAGATNSVINQDFVVGTTQSYTASVWLMRKTGTGTVTLCASNDGTSCNVVTLTNKWARYSATASSIDYSSALDPSVYIKIATSGDAVYAWGGQLENSVTMSSYVPVAAGTAMNRTAEVLKYEIAGNRTAAQESFALRFFPLFESSLIGSNYVLLDADTKQRVLQRTSGGTVYLVKCNATDNGSFSASAATLTASYTPITFGGICSNVGNPNHQIYINGTQEGVDDNSDLTTNAWGTYWYLGGSTGSTDSRGIIQRVVFFSNVKSAENQKNLYNMVQLGL